MKFEESGLPRVVSDHPSTRAALSFQSDVLHCLKLLQFLAEITVHKDETEAVLQNRQLKPGEDGPLGTQLAYSRPLVCELILCRMVDNFLQYVIDLLREIHQKRPETIKSADTVRLDELLERSSIESIIDWLVERKVQQLSHRGMRDLASYVNRTLGFDLFAAPEDLETATLLVEIRNAIVHNRGRVSDVNAKRDARLREVVGKRIDVEILDLAMYTTFLQKAVKKADERATEKFGLQQVLQRLAGEGLDVVFWPGPKQNAT